MDTQAILDLAFLIVQTYFMAALQVALALVFVLSILNFFLSRMSR